MEKINLNRKYKKPDKLPHLTFISKDLVSASLSFSLKQGESESVVRGSCERMGLDYERVKKRANNWKSYVRDI